MHTYENNGSLTMHGELTDQKSFGGSDLNRVLDTWRNSSCKFASVSSSFKHHTDLVSLLTSSVGYLCIQD
jgi:hypothetical protein